MAIFMDRHDLLGATAADLAEAHRKDLEIQDQYGVKFMTYWFDEQRGTVFCLVDAPDRDTVQCVHREAHGHVPGEIVEVAISAVEAFLGRIQDPAPQPGEPEARVDGGLRTIMFTDIVGSTEMTARLGDRMAAELIRAHDGIVRSALGKFGGREVKHMGDGIMASFDAAAPAIESARQIQRNFARYNEGNPEPVHVRIGLDSGEPVTDSNDLFGSTVQMAARLCNAALSDQILVSESLVKDHPDPTGFTKTKRRKLKGFSRPVTAFECAWAPAAK
jgi:class 3 adenylate cyclase